MRKIFSRLLILAGILLLAGCSKDDFNNEEEPVTPPVPADYDNLRDSLGTATRPTDWIPVAELDPTSIQLLTITEKELPTDITAEDLLAAFVGSECRAVSEVDTVEDKTLSFFSMVIQSALEQSDTEQNVQLRYYSLHNRRIYIADEFPFVPGEILGSLNDGGYKVNWR